MEGTPKPGVRVMRKSQEELAVGANTAPTAHADVDATFFATLSDGREVILREMMADDLLFVEKLSSAGDMERSLKLAARLSTGGGRITYDELRKLKMRDLRKVTDLLAKAGGTDEDEGEGDGPND
jgi:hypothetical protein